MKKQFLFFISILLCTLFSTNSSAQSDTLNYNAWAAVGGGSLASVTLNNFSTCQSKVYLDGGAGIWDGVSWSTGTLEVIVNGTSIGTFSPQTIDLTAYIPVTSVEVKFNHYYWHQVSAFVRIVETPAANGPTVSNASECQGNLASPLTANYTGTGVSLKWYTSVNGDNYSTSVTPTTTNVGVTSYWVAQADASGCESKRSQIDFTVKAPTTGDTTATACESFNWYGTNYTTSGTPTHLLTNVAGCDSTVTLHLTINQPTTGDTTATACESFNWYGTNYTTSGTPTHLLLNAAGCDSTVTLHLTINQPTTGDTTATACESFNWYGTNYTTSGTPTHLLLNAAGCDSTVTLHLTINQPTTGDTTATACESFNWYGTDYTTSGTPTHVLINAVGCDSTVTLHLTINQPTTSTTTKTACNSFIWNGASRTSTGTYTFNTTNAAGCDSTATLILTIGTLSVTANVVNNDKLEAVSSGTNLTYRWVDCNLDAYIEGATGATFDVPKIGKYAVEVSDGICKTMSSCVSMNQAAVNENDALHLGVKVYPNPTSGMVTVMVSGADQVSIHLYDGTGKLIKTYTNFHSGETISLEEFSTGFYTLQIQTENGIQMERLVKN